MNASKTLRKGGTATIGAMCLLLAAAGCYEHTYTVGAGAPNAPVAYDKWHQHWIGGLISPDQEVRVREVCASGDATIHQELTFLNGLVSALTGGIFTPMTVKVRCRNGRRTSVDLSADDVARIVADPGFLDRVNTLLPDRLSEVQQALDGLDR